MDEINALEAIGIAKGLMNNIYIHGLFLCVFLDILLGVLCSLAMGENRSRKGINGLVKHIAVLLVVTLSYPYIVLIGFKTVMNGIVVFFILNYIVSMLETFDCWGVRFPKFLTSKIKKLRDFYDEYEEEEKKDK